MEVGGSEPIFDTGETNPYFIYKPGYIVEKLMTSGPRTLKLFKVVGVSLVPSILTNGVKPYNNLVREGKRLSLTQTLKGEGDASFWTLGKVNFFMEVKRVGSYWSLIIKTF